MDDIRENRADGAPFVVLSGDEPVSGLTDMLHQFIEQTLAASPRKRQLAQRLSGCTAFRSAEDEDLCVRITFADGRIELRDGTPKPGDAMITADFLTIAHLTSGQESPLRLLARRKLKARFSVFQIPFLLRMLRFMQIESERPGATPLRWAWLAAAAAAGGAIYWYVVTHN
ncbi:MAG: SCP2 sterol-binding domain-containing protein [Candidatus Binatia bacterium]